MGKVITVLKKIPAAWQAFMALVAFFLAGAALSGWINLPARVDSVEAQVNTNTEEIHAIRDEHAQERNLMLRMLCNQDPAETFQSCERRYSGVGGQPGGGG